MKNRNLLYNIGIVVVLIAISLVVYYRFLATKPTAKSDVAIKKIETLTVIDTSGTEIKFSRLLGKGESTYLFLFEMDDCYSCIYKGMRDLVQLKKDGKNTAALVIHELIDEVDGWSAKQDYAPFFMIKKTTFYDHISISITPVIMKIADGKVESFRYIKP